MKAAISPKHGGARLAAAAILFIMLVPVSLAGSPYNFTQISYNESTEPIVITTPYIEPIIGLLAVIAFCNLFELLIKLQAWILSGGEKKNE